MTYSPSRNYSPHLEREKNQSFESCIKKIDFSLKQLILNKPKESEKVILIVPNG